ncbi:MAG TPA: C-terminal helicase domain-containing protein, partial [Dermatophilaceae bacterium]|nr:C-terminal helicase domain-containing protein [Dermatophilaceae bacterium]
APVFGPVPGSLPRDARQSLIDDFATHERAGVLVSQIEAGGVGTNIQAASVVVLCEPQVKPSAETQAIARVHRMGQVRSVQVHRLLGDDSVDERMLEILAGKTAVFDTYVRESAMGDSAPEAIDISERNLAARIIAAEQERLQVGPQDAPNPSGSPQDASTVPDAPQDAR